jgi:hypothetical protein
MEIYIRRGNEWHKCPSEKYCLGLLRASGFSISTSARISREGKEFDAGMSPSFSIAGNYAKDWSLS